MDTHDVVTEVTEWAAESTDPSLNTYAFGPSFKTQALPDVVVEVAAKRLTSEDPLFPYRGLQQKWVKVWSLALSIMVDNADEAAAAEALETYADQLEAALLQDGSLGGRVPFASPFLSFDFTAPFVEYADGTRGREMNVVMHVGDLVEDPS